MAIPVNPNHSKKCAINNNEDFEWHPGRHIGQTGIIPGITLFGEAVGERRGLRNEGERKGKEQMGKLPEFGRLTQANECFCRQSDMVKIKLLSQILQIRDV